MPAPTREAVQRIGHTATSLQLLTDRLVWRILVTRQHLRDAQWTIAETERLLTGYKRAARRPRLYLVRDSDETEGASAAPGSDDRSGRRNKLPSGPGSPK